MCNYRNMSPDFIIFSFKLDRVSFRGGDKLETLKGLLEKSRKTNIQDGNLIA